MADQFTGEIIPASQIESAITERLGDGMQSPAYESFGYNVASDGTPSYPKSCRKMRMEEDFRKFQQQELQNQRLMQQMELSERSESRLQRDQDLMIEKMKMDEDRAERVQSEASAMMSSIRGAIAPDGTTISNPIRPEDPNAIERLDNLARDFKYGVENSLASSMFKQLYGDALKFREARINESKENELAAANLSVRTGKPFDELGTYDEQGMFQPKIQGIVAGEEEIKAKEAAKEEEKAVKRERRGEEARAGVRAESDIVSEEKRIRGDVRRAKEELRKLNASFAGRKSLSATQQANLKAAKDTILDLEIEKADLRGLAFDTEQEAEAANPPSGSIIYIGRKPNKVP
jgi:hypothetical protein